MGLITNLGGNQIATVSNMASSVATLVTGAGGQTQDPSVALRDLQLTQPLKDLMKPTLDSLGFIFAEATAKPKYDFRPHSYTTIGNGRIVRHALHIASWVLDTPNDQNLNALSSLAYAFENLTLFVFSEKLSYPHLRIHALMAEGWLKRMNISVNFVPWRHVEDLTSMSEEERSFSIRLMLKLDAPLDAGDETILQLQGDQRERLETALGEALLESDLELLVESKLKEKLTNFTTPADTLPVKINKLVGWAITRNRLEELITKACEINSTHKGLSAIKKELLR